MNILHHSLLIYLLDAVHCYVNVALYKPAYQENPLKANDITGDASNAVDGKKSNLDTYGGECVVSIGSLTATWWVNLTSIHNIQNVTIYYVTDDKPWDSSNRNAESFLGFSVYVSNTTDKVQGTLCFRDTNFIIEDITAVFTVVCREYGQYVIYYNERRPNETYPRHVSRYADNNLCEVEVYGCPSNGCYGSNHSYPCPDVNCQYCHKMTGTCQVCKPGYKGHKCEIECDTGRYGINCSTTCGNCHHQSQCHNIDGSCSEGCSAGYKGPLCTESKYL